MLEKVHRWGNVEQRLAILREHNSLSALCYLMGDSHDQLQNVFHLEGKKAHESTDEFKMPCLLVDMSCCFVGACVI